MNKLKIIIFLYFNLSIAAFSNPNINARTGILVDFFSDEILYEFDSETQIYPASMTKIMTSIIAFDLLNKNKLSLEDEFVISENAWRLSQNEYINVHNDQWPGIC